MNGYEKRSNEKKQAILTASFNLMNSDTGLTTLNTEVIAKNANVSKTSIFKYFGSKDNLISEVYKDFLNRIGDDAQKILEAKLPFEETIKAIGQNDIKHIKEVNQQFYYDMMNFLTTTTDTDLVKLIDNYTKQGIELLMDVFHQGRKEGKVDMKYSDEFLILYFQAQVEGVSNPKVYNNLLPYMDEWTEMLIKGLAPNK